MTIFNFFLNKQVPLKRFKKTVAQLLFPVFYGLSIFYLSSATTFATSNKPDRQANYCSLSGDQVAKALGWVNSHETQCGGYYLEDAYIYPINADKKETVEITSKKGLISQRSTSTLEGKVLIMRYGQQITTNKAFIYRDPETWKLKSIEMIGNVHLREPNTLIIAKRGKYFLETKEKNLFDLLYRTALSKDKQIIGTTVSGKALSKKHKVKEMTAWGKAASFIQQQPRIYQLAKASYTTCPPNITPAWQVRASKIHLDKNTGRGTAIHARLLVKDVPVLYTPYLNFPIDNRRKTGFLWPTFGIASNEWGPYIRLPFYWNMAPNYDYTFTPGILSKRGIQLGNDFRYLSEHSKGRINLTILPGDRAFADFQNSAATNTVFTNSSNSNTQANLNRLLSASTTRKGLSWTDITRYNPRWSSQIELNYASDDYYQRNFGGLNEVTANQLLQRATLSYQSPHWDFFTNLQGYQTLHPLYTDNTVFQNQYRKLPQLALTANYPDEKFGLSYYVYNEATHFEILKTPGDATLKPYGNRLHTQPGISLPYTLPYLFLTPRFQLPLTQYNLTQTADTQTPGTIRRAIPIFDMAAGLSMSRSSRLFDFHFEQTLEPQIYYTYIPYHNQNRIPVFDTINSTLSYDQLFNYNRFSGIDRFGDANQLSIGINSRIIDSETGFEKARIGVGEVIYFTDRLVTLCSGITCNDQIVTSSNSQRLSPISAVLDYHLNPSWTFKVDPFVWDPKTRQLNNTTLTFHYQTARNKLLNFSYAFVHGGDSASGVAGSDSSNNLKVTDISAAWPVSDNVSVVGRWTENWNRVLLQNLLYGVQYDTCCWAVRMVGGRQFLGLDSNNSNQPQYKNEFYIQFSLKGLGDIGSGDPKPLLNAVTGYDPRFGQEF